MPNNKKRRKKKSVCTNTVGKITILFSYIHRRQDRIYSQARRPIRTSPCQIKINGFYKSGEKCSSNGFWQGLKKTKQIDDNFPISNLLKISQVKLTSVILAAEKQRQQRNQQPTSVAKISEHLPLVLKP